MARAALPFVPVSPACLVAQLREITEMLESRSPFIRSTERFYISGEAGERLSVVGCRLSVVGCRLSVVGCRLSVVGCSY